MDTAHAAQIRHQLQAQLGRLQRRVGRIESDLRAPHAADWTEKATELENDEVLEHLDAAGRLEVAAIRAAISRLDHGTYGKCSTCGTAIDPRRLEAMPTTTTCLTCTL